MCKIGSPLLSFLLCSLCTPLQYSVKKITEISAGYSLSRIAASPDHLTPLYVLPGTRAIQSLECKNSYRFRIGDSGRCHRITPHSEDIFYLYNQAGRWNGVNESVDIGYLNHKDTCSGCPCSYRMMFDVV